jgi:hypothetical protein
MSKGVHYCERCGNQDAEVMVWAGWNVKTQTWEYVSDGLDNQTYCEQCEGYGFRVVFGTRKEAKAVAARYAAGESGYE